MIGRSWTPRFRQARLLRNGETISIIRDWLARHNRRKFEIIVVGSGLAGGSAAATLGELGYRVKCFCFQDIAATRALRLQPKVGSTRRKIIKTMATAFTRLFYDTIKGGNFRSREANVYRLAEIRQ